MRARIRPFSVSDFCQKKPRSGGLRNEGKNCMRSSSQELKSFVQVDIIDIFVVFPGIKLRLPRHNKLIVNVVLSLTKVLKLHEVFNATSSQELNYLVQLLDII